MSTNGFYSWNITHCNHNQRQEIKNDSERSCPLGRPTNMSFLINVFEFQLKRDFISLCEMYRKSEPSWSNYQWPHFQIMAGLILRDLTFPMLITHLPTTQSHSWGLGQWEIWVMWYVASAWEEKLCSEDLSGTLK